mmetsp:Transcript_123616/g.395454  ORF Transcript_123616/g.395454 Transcript_123616/m.395454 type:complete len:304 (-) Transcript_123616:3253-4164(-)
MDQVLQGLHLLVGGALQEHEELPGLLHDGHILPEAQPRHGQVPHALRGGAPHGAGEGAAFLGVQELGADQLEEAPQLVRRQRRELHDGAGRRDAEHLGAHDGKGRPRARPNIPHVPQLVPDAQDAGHALVPQVRGHRLFRRRACEGSGAHELGDDPEHQRGLEEVRKEVRRRQPQGVLQEGREGWAGRLHGEVDGVQHPEPHRLRGLLRELDQRGRDIQEVGAGLRRTGRELACPSEGPQHRPAEQRDGRAHGRGLRRGVRADVLQDGVHHRRLVQLVVDVEERRQHLDVKSSDGGVGLLEAV